MVIFAITFAVAAPVTNEVIENLAESDLNEYSLSDHKHLY